VESGHDGVRRFVRVIRRAFTDLRIEVEVLAKDRNRAAWQRTLTARHGGPFRGFPPTGRRIVWHDMLVSEFRDGLIAEEWAVSDLAERLLLARRP
jgi:predicted ester cyclase